MTTNINSFLQVLSEFQYPTGNCTPSFHIRPAVYIERGSMALRIAMIFADFPYPEFGQLESQPIFRLRRQDNRLPGTATEEASLGSFASSSVAKLDDVMSATDPLFHVFSTLFEGPSTPNESRIGGLVIAFLRVIVSIVSTIWLVRNSIVIEIFVRRADRTIGFRSDG
jgi:hypothetical protein